jgi:hypothetical protein
MIVFAAWRSAASVRIGCAELWVGQAKPTAGRQDKSASTAARQVIEMTCFSACTAVGRGHAARILPRNSTPVHAHGLSAEAVRRR